MWAWAAGDRVPFTTPLVTIQNAGRVLVRDYVFLDSRTYRLDEHGGGSRGGNTYRIVDGYGWAGPHTPPDLYGSLRMTVARNRVESAAGDGIVLGYRGSPWFPFAGVKDVHIVDNAIDVRGPRVVLGGVRDETHRVTVSDGRTKQAAPPWSVPAFAWEGYDTGEARRAQR
jgi:hypothetical protein